MREADASYKPLAVLTNLNPKDVTSFFFFLNYTAYGVMRTSSYGYG